MQIQHYSYKNNDEKKANSRKTITKTKTTYLQNNRIKNCTDETENDRKMQSNNEILKTTMISRKTKQQYRKRQEELKTTYIKTNEI